MRGIAVVDSRPDGEHDKIKERRSAGQDTANGPSACDVAYSINGDKGQHDLTISSSCRWLAFSGRKGTYKHPQKWSTLTAFAKLKGRNLYRTYLTHIDTKIWAHIFVRDITHVVMCCIGIPYMLFELLHCIGVHLNDSVFSLFLPAIRIGSQTRRVRKTLWGKNY